MTTLADSTKLAAMGLTVSMSLAIAQIDAARERVTCVLGEPTGWIECSAAGVFRVQPSVARQDGDPHRERIAIDGRMFVGARRDGGYLFGGGLPGKRGRVVSVDRAGRTVASIDVARDVVLAIAVHENAFAIACADGSVHVGAIDRSGEPRIVRELSTHRGGAYAVAFDASGSTLVSGGKDGLVRVYDAEEWARDERGDADSSQVRCLELDSHTSPVLQVAFVPARDGTHTPEIASSSEDGAVRIHSKNGRLLRSWLGLARDVRGLAPWRGSLVIAAGDGRLAILDRASEQVRTLGEGGPALLSLGIVRCVGGIDTALCATRAGVRRFVLDPSDPVHRQKREDAGRESPQPRR
ncbi:MAG: hypothetical protein H6832_09880 [Planctomycetes bacterium]|nr:hypothetical protein [Planctomycetota bacterium]MCB9891843.1 hypothetical protein [Planctomycetota bacterium]MCB9918699.1 hypothetical protein [Planctomycetota bacterium]